MKKFLSCMIVLCLLICSCARMPYSVYFYDITSANSPSVTVDIKFAEEQQYKDSYVDVVIYAFEDNLALNVKEEYSDSCQIVLPKKETWYSLTVLMNRANGISQDEYQKYQDALERVYIFESEKDTSIKLKAINGMLETSSTNMQLLTNWKTISKEYSYNIPSRNV